LKTSVAKKLSPKKKGATKKWWLCLSMFEPFQEWYCLNYVYGCEPFEPFQLSVSVILNHFKHVSEFGWVMVSCVWNGWVKACCVMTINS
jgi:hypothetical protein